MSSADVLSWERVTSGPLFDHLLLVFPLSSTSEANARDLAASMPKLVELASTLRRFDPAVQSVEVGVVELATVTAGLGLESPCAYGLQIKVRYPDYLTRAEIHRRRMHVLAALVSV